LKKETRNQRLKGREAGGNNAKNIMVVAATYCEPFAPLLPFA
jgi:hypothetical protein